MGKHDYMPSRETDLLSWSRNLANKLLAGPGDYGLTSQQVADYDEVQLAFANAYSVVHDPMTRCKPNIEAKNHRRKALIGASRSLVAVMQAWPEMTNAKRDLLDIPIRDRDLTPIGPPTETPSLEVLRVQGNLISLRVRPSGSETGARPEGVRGVRLWKFVGEDSPSDPREYVFAGSSTNTRPQIMMPEGTPANTKVWIIAAWFNPRDQAGPACPAVSVWTNHAAVNMAA